MRTLTITILSLILVHLFAVNGVMAASATSALSEQSNTTAAITIKVTPRELPGGAWEFKIVFDTHSGELNDDLLKTAALLDDKGGRYSPVQWDSAGPGGHHREGDLRFKPISPRPPSIELRITRPGESTPRSFRWQLN